MLLTNYTWFELFFPTAEFFVGCFLRKPNLGGLNMFQVKNSMTS